MTKGYIFVAQNNNEHNYLKMAYALALSIKTTQTQNAVAVVSDRTDILKKLERQPWDHLIQIETDRAQNSDWKLENIIDLEKYSPFDEFVILDCDMLFLTNVSHWWDKMSDWPICFSTKAQTYRGDVIDNSTNIYRQEFIENKLPNVYMAYSYFQKSDQTQELFSLVQEIHDNWSSYVDKFLYSRKPKVFSTDVAFALAAKLLGVVDKVDELKPFPYITHMKTRCQGWHFNTKRVTEDWTNYVDVSLSPFQDKFGLKIGTYRQTGVFHYHYKPFLTDEIVLLLEEYYDQQ